MTTVGPEQEYFLVDKGDVGAAWIWYIQGVLFRSKVPKGRRWSHYFGIISRASGFYEGLDEEL